jgi:6-pyruvoyltetrahydropterin/6-carboxytetrahydropterin synthase
MYSARVEADFAAAHFLSHYHGKCENLHGHNYRVVLWVRGEKLDAGGMLADFGLLKKCLKALIAPLDHSNLNDLPIFNGDPSAERIASYIFGQVEKTLGDFSIDPLLLWAIDVYETPLNMARYEKAPSPH